MSGALKRRTQVKSDLAWNMASLVILALSGVVLNALIARFYSAEALGVFNQVLSAYIFFSQAAVGGINLSTLRESTRFADDPENLAIMSWGALLLTFVLSAAVTLLFCLSAPWLSELLDSPGVLKGMLAVAPGLFFFALNKVLLSVVNGLQHMRAFAVFQALRYLFILAAFIGALLLKAPGDSLSVVFSVSETLLFLGLVVYLRFTLGLRWNLAQSLYSRRKALNDWGLLHLSFGYRSALSGVLLELNSRVDILMLGVFRSDRDVGIYSFASMIAEGFYQLLVVFQNNLNPYMAGFLQKKGHEAAHEDRAEFEEFLKKTKFASYALMGFVALIAIMAFPWGARILSPDPIYQESRLIFGILMGGIFLASGYIPFQQILSMGGHPGWQTLYMAACVGVNFFAAAVLIPQWAGVGAALATAASMLVSALLIRILSRRFYKVRL